MSEVKALSEAEWSRLLGILVTNNKLNKTPTDAEFMLIDRAMATDRVRYRRTAYRAAVKVLHEGTGS